MRKPFEPFNKALFTMLLVAAFWGALWVCASTLYAQARGDATAQQTIQSAVDSELRANYEDKSVWKYLDEDDAPGKAATYNAIETPQGELRRLIKLDGHPLGSEAEQSEVDRIQRYIHDPSAQARARKDGEHDGKQAVAFTKMLPAAFQWTIVNRTPEEITLHFSPNPSFDPPTLEARVLAAMEGQIVVSLEGYRIRSLRGRLTHDVKFGYGFFGKMYEGGTFNVERRQVGGGHWEITETHVHIGGRALLFKNIGQDSDEVKTEWSPSTAKTLDEAAKELGVQP